MASFEPKWENTPNPNLCSQTYFLHFIQMASGTEKTGKEGIFRVSAVDFIL